MIRNVLVSTCAVLALSAVTACQNKADRDLAKAEEAQREANEKASTAQQEANKKIDEAHRQANENMQKAQSKAAEEMNAAVASFNKDRGDYREKVQKEIDQVDKTLSDARAKDAKATPKEKAELQATTRDCQARRELLVADIRSIDTSTKDGWSIVRVNLDRDLGASGAPKCALNATEKTIQGKRVIETRHTDDQGKPIQHPTTPTEPVGPAPNSVHNADGTWHPNDVNHNTTKPHEPVNQP
jgi:hypothetical protein